MSEYIVFRNTVISFRIMSNYIVFHNAMIKVRILPEYCFPAILS